jgi:hypothetical protein
MLNTKSGTDSHSWPGGVFALHGEVSKITQ